jgi:hypothetical protein
VLRVIPTEVTCAQPEAPTWQTHLIPHFLVILVPVLVPHPAATAIKNKKIRGAETAADCGSEGLRCRLKGTFLHMHLHLRLATFDRRPGLFGCGLRPPCFFVIPLSSARGRWRKIMAASRPAATGKANRWTASPISPSGRDCEVSVWWNPCAISMGRSRPSAGVTSPACLLISALISAAQRLLNPAMTPHAIVSAPSRNQFRQNKEASPAFAGLTRVWAKSVRFVS